MWDAERPELKGFRGIEAFPPGSRAGAIEARWEAYRAPREVEVPSVTGQPQRALAPGKAHFEVGGRAVSLEPTADGDALFFVFKDATAPKETYGAGRFLAAEAPRDGKVDPRLQPGVQPALRVLRRTPPVRCRRPENVLPVRIEAGEKLWGHSAGAARPGGRLGGIAARRVRRPAGADRPARRLPDDRQPLARGRRRGGRGGQRPRGAAGVALDHVADEVVLGGLGHLDGDDLAGVGDAVVDVDDPVDLRRLLRVAAGQEVLGLLARGPPPAPRSAARSSPAGASREMRFWIAMIRAKRARFTASRHLSGHRRRRACPPRPSTGTRRAARSAAPPRTRAVLEVLLGLARAGPTMSEVRSARPGHAGAQLREQLARNSESRPRFIGAEQPVGGVLQRHVQVLRDLRLARRSPR